MREDSRWRHGCPCVHSVRGHELHYTGAGQVLMGWPEVETQPVPGQLSPPDRKLEVGEYGIVVLYLT